MGLEPWLAKLILGLGLAMAVTIVLLALVIPDRRRHGPKRGEDDEPEPR